MCDIFLYHVVDYEANILRKVDLSGNLEDLRRRGSEKAAQQCLTKCPRLRQQRKGRNKIKTKPKVKLKVKNVLLLQNLG